MILLISVLECTIYIKKRNDRKQQLLETTIEDINEKEKRIKQHKEELEQYKNITQQSEAQSTKINELETLKEEIIKEIEENNQTLENLEQELYN